MKIARAGAFALVLALLVSLAPAAPAMAAIPPAQRGLLQRYLAAVSASRFDVAFRLLSDEEQRYFESPANLASVFAADRFKLESYRIIESKSAPPLGTVAVVSERIAFFDAVRQSPASATVKAVYGIVPGKHGLGIKDSGHPWHIVVAANPVHATANGVTLTLRRVSFYTGRIDVVVTFANRADRAVTFLPYGRTVLRDEIGMVYQPIESRDPALTDRTLYTGLRLPSSAQYTGRMDFVTPDRFRPKALTLTVAPALADGADAPFDLVFPEIPIAE